MTTFRMGLLAIAALPLLAYRADAEELQCALVSGNMQR